MRPADVTCACERDVLDLVAIGQWPLRADDALRAHVAACATCAEVAAVAVAVREWAGEPAPVKVPDASVVWYLAQVRAREEAARRASRPVLAAQAVAVAVLVLAVVTIGPGVEWYLSLVPDVSLPTVSLPEVSEWNWLSWAVLAAVGAWIFVGSIAYLLTARE